jgi:hypothetical protein
LLDSSAEMPAANSQTAFKIRKEKPEDEATGISEV